MKEFLLFGGLLFWVGSLFDTRLSEYIYLLWLVAFLLSWFGASLLLSLCLFISTASYYFMDTHSNNTLNASVLPWVFGISLCINMIVLIFKYHSSGRSDSGGIDIDIGCGGGD